MGKKVELGINNTFAIKKWVEPEEWARVIVEEIGLNNIQLSFDLFYPSLKESDTSFMCNEINIAVKKYKAKISSSFTGLNVYSQNMLGHPNPMIRKSALEYYVDAIKISSNINIPVTGGHFLAFTMKDFNNKETREYLMQSLFESIIYLSKIAYEHKLSSLTLEYMATPYELPHTMKEAKKFFEEINAFSKVPVYLTFDLGHTSAFDLDVNDKNKDVYHVLENVIPMTNIIHLQQTDGLGDRHWPFTAEFNEIGVIKPEKVLKIINDNSDHQIDLIFECMHSCEISGDKIIEDFKYSADYWKKHM
jgi:D-erythrulose 1-phosphate 3-epimerase